MLQSCQGLCGLETFSSIHGWLCWRRNFTVLSLSAAGKLLARGKAGLGHGVLGPPNSFHPNVAAFPLTRALSDCPCSHALSEYYLRSLGNVFLTLLGWKCFYDAHIIKICKK